MNATMPRATASARRPSTWRVEKGWANGDVFRLVDQYGNHALTVGVDASDADAWARDTDLADMAAYEAGHLPDWDYHVYEKHEWAERTGHAATPVEDLSLGAGEPDGDIVIELTPPQGAYWYRPSLPEVRHDAAHGRPNAMRIVGDARRRYGDADDAHLAMVLADLAHRATPDRPLTALGQRARDTLAIVCMAYALDYDAHTWDRTRIRLWAPGIRVVVTEQA
ncbi:MAG: hypothetical protein UHD09_09235 [Bifidobacterium sp.]|nr:hypothetical protein [Bifidobacterium sp.]